MDAISTIMGVESKVAGAVNAITGGFSPKLAKKLEKAAKDGEMADLSREVVKEKLTSFQKNRDSSKKRIEKLNNRINKEMRR